MNLPRSLLLALVLILTAASFGQTQAAQNQSSPAPDFLAYQALFRSVVWLENQAGQEDAKLGAGNPSSTSIRSQILKAAGLTDVEYAALVAIAQDYVKAQAAYIGARDLVLTAVYAQQAAGGRATWAQAIQLSDLFKQHVAMVDDHIAQLADRVGGPGAQSLANYVHTTVAANTVWSH